MAFYFRWILRLPELIEISNHKKGFNSWLLWKKQTELDLKLCNSRAEQLSQTWMVSVGSITLKVFTQVQQLERLFWTLLSWRNAEKYSWPKKAAFSAQMTSCRKWKGVFFVCYNRQLQNTRVISGSVGTAIFAWLISLFISSCLVFLFSINLQENTHF